MARVDALRFEITEVQSVDIASVDTNKQLMSRTSNSNTGSPSC